MQSLTPLDELLPGWTGPADLASLWEAEVASLDDTARELRRHAVAFRNSLDQQPIHGPEQVADLLARGVLRPLHASWLIVPLDATRRRVLAPVLSTEALEALAQAATDDNPARAARRVLARPGATRWAWQSKVVKRVPTAADLDEALPLPTGGCYLVIGGGSPGVLDTSGVARALDELLGEAPVCDVVFWQTQSNAAPTCFSLGRGQGDQAGRAVPFPNPGVADQLRATLTKEVA